MVKLLYRKQLMRTVINAANDCNNAIKFERAINILDAIKWIHGAWEYVSQDTIMKCFRHAGFLQEATTATEVRNAIENNEATETRAVIEDITLSEEMEFLPEVYRSQLPSIEAIGNFNDKLEVHEDVAYTAEDVLEKVLSTDDKNEEHLQTKRKRFLFLKLLPHINELCSASKN